jgi:hypothetical protein
MSATKADALAQVGKFMNDLNGRDKFGKFMQNAARFMMYRLLTADPKSVQGEQLKSLFVHTREARRLTNLFKTLNELLLLQDALKKGGDPITQGLVVTARVAWMQHWICDNLLFMKQAKIYQTTTDLNYYAMLAWFVALSSGLITSTRDLMNLQAQEKALKAKERTDETKKAWQSLQDKKARLVISMFGNFADLLCALNGIQIPHKVLGWGFNDGVLGALGMISSVIAGYYRWKDLNP